MFENLEFYGKALRIFTGLTLTRATQQIQAVGHQWTYRETPSPKNVVVIGGSYAGTHLVQRLTETLPTGYRAVLIERNSHFNHLFAFPRFSVVQGKEHLAFIPYDGMASTAPAGIVQHMQDSVTSITSNKVHLASGKTVEYEYLALATGSWQPPPSKVSSTEKREACEELRLSQNRIQEANRIAVIGGGPVGIQIATDIKSYFPQKDVTLVHSRQQLLPSFGLKLHEHVLETLDRLKIKVILGQRPQLVPSGTASKETLAFEDGRKVGYDLVIPCTGQRPNSELLAQMIPPAICPTTRQILVHNTMQVAAGSNEYPHIFALGDVAKCGGPRMARAARVQADVVVSNILAMINEEEPSTFYQPAIYEGVIKLTLGKTETVWYGQDEHGRELMKIGKEKDDNLNIGHAWSNLGVRFEPTVSA